jgi:hypothetical protein
LLVLANEIGFSDRPSIRFDNASGNVGVRTPFRSFPEVPNPLHLVIHEPPTGPIEDIYGPFVAADSKNHRIRRIFLEGLANNQTFQERYVSTGAKYGDFTGGQIVAALCTDETLLDADLGDVRGFEDAFDMSTTKGRRDTLRVLLADASIHVTTAVLGAEEHGLVPVTDDPFLARLIALRIGEDESRIEPTVVDVGYELVRAVVPDEVLGRLDIPDLLKFRAKTADIYTSWGQEVERLRAILDEPSTEALPDRVRKLVVADVVPKMNALRVELSSMRDSLFGDVIKSAVDWKLPALAIALFHHDPLLASALAVLGGAASAGVKAAVDRSVKRRDIVRKNGFAYLVQLQQDLGAP